MSEKALNELLKKIYSEVLDITGIIFAKRFYMGPMREEILMKNRILTLF